MDYSYTLAFLLISEDFVNDVIARKMLESYLFGELGILLKSNFPNISYQFPLPSCLVLLE